MKRALFVLCGVLLNQGALAQLVSTSSVPITLEAVNGEVVRDEVKIERTLSNPILVSVKQQDLSQPLKTLSINNATLTSGLANEVDITLRSSLKGGASMNTQIAIGLWLDGERVPLSGKQKGSEVRLRISKTFSSLELRVIKPITMYLPKDYRGQFNYTLVIEGLSE